MFIHELAHLVAAVSIGLKVAYISIQPFGFNLRLKNKIINSLSDEIILYSAGPLINIIFAIIGIIIYSRSTSIYAYDFYLKNISLFIINLLPILPLDGGVILKKIIMYKKGYRFAHNCMLIIGGIITIFLIIVSVYLVWINKFNYSVIMLTVFMIGNIFTQKEKYNIDFVREIIHYKNKSQSKTVKVYVMPEYTNLSDISLSFNMQNYFIVFFVDKSGEIVKIMTETEILNQITK